MKLAPHANRFGASLTEDSSVQGVFVWVCIRARMHACVCVCVCVCLDMWLRERGSTHSDRQPFGDQQGDCSWTLQTISTRSTPIEDYYWRLILGFAWGLDVKCQTIIWYTNTSPLKKKLCVTISQQEVMLIAFSTSCVWCTMTWPFGIDIEFCFLCWISEAFEVYHWVEERKTIGSCIVTAPYHTFLAMQQFLTKNQIWTNPSHLFPGISLHATSTSCWCSRLDL